MKAKELLQALALPLEIAKSAAGISPIWQHVRVAGGKASATNGSLSVEIEADLPDLRCCGPAARLATALNTIASLAGDAEVKLKVTDKRLSVTAPKVRQSMPIMPADDMPTPAWPAGEQPIKDWPALVSALQFVAPAASRKDSYAALMGVATIAGALAATDRHRAHVAYGEAQLADNLVIPIAAVDVICSLPEGRAFAASESLLAIYFKGGKLLVQLVSSKFPSLQFVPEKHGGNVVSVERTALERAVGAVRKAQLTKAANLNFATDKISVEDDSADGEARVEVEVAYTGEPWSYGVYSQYLLEACQALDGEQLTLSWDGERMKPLRLTGKKGSRCAVIMQWQK